MLQKIVEGKKFISNKKHVLIESGFAFAVRVLSAFATFILNLVIARQFGSFNSGYFFLCLTITTVLSTILRFGSDNLLIRYAGIYNSNKTLHQLTFLVKKFGKILIIFSVGLTVLLLTFNSFIATYFFKKEELGPILFWMLLSVPFLTVAFFLSYVLQGLRKVTLSVSIQGIFVQVGLSILILILKPVSAVELAKLYLAACIANMIVALFACRNYLPALKDNEGQLPPNIWNASYTLWIFSILLLGIQWGGQFIGGIYIKPDEFAQFAIAQRTSALISFILVAVNMISAPRFASLYNQKKYEELKKYAINSTRLMVLFATPLVIFILLFPTFILQVFGKDFINAAPMLRILCLGQYVNVLTGSVGYLLMMSGHEKDLKNITAIFGSLALLLNYILIKNYGALGGSIAIALSIALQNIVMAGMVKKRLGFNTLNIFPVKGRFS
ncbi:hypothetical protein FC093_13965 [Ilyomonas limi]|uniref:Polysaccharide biosynthesis protein C-terminal domain-containing protein n=1 Tax=Ilyomonas limi TaxID=2575867 RepID=A0A4V5UVF8_9BACT|nr:MATE family efflux transporter [Ilyomonas limi]TKK67403.1 hypothetical protein FC093_13965 [Ilyomonas limi]